MGMPIGDISTLEASVDNDKKAYEKFRKQIEVDSKDRSNIRLNFSI